jgi:hypothetical protein
MYSRPSLNFIFFTVFFKLLQIVIPSFHIHSFNIAWWIAKVFTYLSALLQFGLLEGMAVSAFENDLQSRYCLCYRAGSSCIV